MCKVASKQLQFCSRSFPLPSYYPKARELRERCPGKQNCAPHHCPVVKGLLIIIILLQKQESDQTLLASDSKKRFKGLLPCHLHRKWAPSGNVSTGHHGQTPTSPLPPWAAQVQGSSKLAPASAVANMLCIITGHSVVLSELCSSWLASEHIPPAWGRDRGELVLPSADMSYVQMGSGDTTPSRRQFKTRLLEAFFVPFFPFLSFSVIGDI